FNTKTQEGYEIMKIVLRQDVPKLGEAGTIQTVADGYARNYLIPKGYAVLATDGEIRTAEHNLKVRERKVLRQEEALQSLADKINGTRLEFTARAGEQGRLFGSVTTSDIAEQLQEKISEEIDRRKIQLTEPLRTVGEHEVEIHLVGRLRPTITVTIQAEQTEEDQAAEEAAGETTMDAEAEAEVGESADEEA
ncbi:MAG TPA: 50S ribosomal protein L9, partial [Thermomicrobiales bacterium]|nr:50S ribosomal protein L9 [Thermomicrobiales bacterium]